ncbi:hypothetical protein SAMN05216368_103152 [Cryobacterium flavum]|uniref:Uncharacterized protein n=1 Tax=Cryobacterium flavum TaxID=1424659 RepID=A0A5E9FX63_9MICO|nr:hypothetical protein SAMN05216368_103152 [Cryobacterium flavum]
MAVLGAAAHAQAALAALGVLHTMFVYKAKAYPFWYLIPE